MIKKTFEKKKFLALNFLELAIKNQRNNQYKLAIKNYEKYLFFHPKDFKANFNFASLLTITNNLNRAKYYLNKAIKVNSSNYAVYYNLGKINYYLGNTSESIKAYNKSLKLNPSDFASYNNLGNIYKDKKEFKKSIKFYKKAIKNNSKHSFIFYNLGIVLQELGNHKEAISAYKKAIKLNPEDFVSYNNLGSVFNELKQNTRAMDCFKKSLKINPNNPNALNGICIVLQINGENKKSILFAKKAIAINPDSILAHRLIANVNITKLKNYKEAIKQSHNAVKIHHKVENFSDNKVSVTRLKHDVLQAEYTLKKKFKIKVAKKFLEVGKKVLKRKENFLDKNNIDKKIILNSDDVKSLLPYYKKNFIYKTRHKLKESLNPNKNWEEIQRKYFSKKNKQIIYIDNFLSPESVKELREFCLISKVWNKEHKNKYLGATCDRGFISNLHLNIANDLKKFLPKIFGNKELQTFWAYKYEPKISKGINIHADSAKVNLNFWITPNKFNNDNNTGGLRVYDEPAPKSWPFAKYNRNTSEIVKFLKRKKSKFVDIPHRFNRAVLFNSDYFHQTQEVNFKDVYEGRRINITYLFGDRNFYVPI